MHRGSRRLRNSSSNDSDFSSTLQLITDACRRDGLAPDKVRALAERAGGVPLFAEELSRAVIAEGFAEEIPTTLYGCLMARLDRHHAARAVAQLAAAVGRRFELDLLSELGEIDESTLHVGSSGCVRTAWSPPRGLAPTNSATR